VVDTIICTLTIIIPGTARPALIFESLYQAYSAANDLQQFSQQDSRLATHMTGAENCSLMLLQRPWRVVCHQCHGADQHAVRSFRAKVGEGIAGRVVQDGKPLIVEDISKDARFAVYRRTKYRTGSFIACPSPVGKKSSGC